MPDVPSGGKFFRKASAASRTVRMPETLLVNVLFDAARTSASPDSAAVFARMQLQNRPSAEGVADLNRLTWHADPLLKGWHEERPSCFEHVAPFASL
jgi:hypothetical protein